MRDLVVHVLPSVASKWYELGLVLLNPKYDNYLKTIETEEAAKGARACCRKMFDKWLNTEEKASWDKVIEALKKIEEFNEASRIRQLLQGECVCEM